MTPKKKLIEVTLPLEAIEPFNKPEDFILATVEFDGDARREYHVHRPFRREPDFGDTSVNYDFA